MNKRTLFLLALLLTGTALAAQDQNINRLGGADQGLFVKHFQVGTTINASDFDIGIGNDNGMGLTWVYCIGSPVCAPATAAAPGDVVALGGGLSLTFSPGGARVVRLTGAGITAGEFDFAITMQISGSAAKTKRYRIIVRDPADVVFVLDRSGSMECAPSEDAAGVGWPGCVNGGAAERRWDVLRESVRQFVDKLDVHHTLSGGSGDRLSVVYFSGSTMNGALVSDVSPFNSISNFQNPVNGIHAEMGTNPVILPADPKLARDGTSLGTALQKAFNNRLGGAATAGRRQVVILFTDGEQNAGAWVKEAGAGVGEIIQVSSVDPTQLLNTSSAALSPIEIYSAGINITPGSGALLSNVADSPSHYFNVLPGDEADFGSDLAGNAFNEIYNQASPQFIRFDKKQLGYKKTVQSDFVCNKYVNRVIFEAYFERPVAKAARYRILKDGVDVTKFARISGGQHINSFIFDLYKLSDLTSQGKWSFILDGASDILQNDNVTLFGTADDHNVDFDGFLGQTKVRVGDVLNPRVKLMENGKPVTAATVKAKILKPGDDIGDLLARTPAPTTGNKNSESGTCGGQKYSYLQAQNPAALEQLKKIEESTITLIHQGNGVYSGSYVDVDVTGTYKIVYTASYNSAALGTVERVEMQTVNVRFPTLVWNLVPTKTGSESTKLLTATITPAYKIGGKTRLVGPSFGNAFGVEGGNVKLSNVSDNCNGSYTMTLSGNLTDRIRLYLSDEPVYNGPANEIGGAVKSDDARGFGLSLHGGITAPLGDLDTTYNRGYFAEADLAYRFSQKFSLEAVGGYYNFDKDYSITAGNLYLKGHFGSGGLSAFAAIGGGVYKPEDKDLAGGLGARAGLGFTLGNKVYFGAEGAYFNIPDYNISFGTFGLALKFFL